MLIEKPEAVLVTLVLLMPGFITLAIQGMFLPARKVEASTEILRLLGLSLWNYAVSFPLIAWIFFDRRFTNNPALLCSTLFCIGVVVPMLVGVLCGIAAQRHWLGKVLGRIGLTAMHPIPVSWDYAFGNRSGVVYVKVTLKDGTIWAGKYGPESFASSYPDECDLFLETVYQIDDAGAWTEHPTTERLLIASGEIRSVEFMRPEPSEEDEQGVEIEQHQLRTSAEGIDEGASTKRLSKRQRVKAAIRWRRKGA